MSCRWGSHINISNFYKSRLKYQVTGLLGTEIKLLMNIWKDHVYLLRSFHIKGVVTKAPTELKLIFDRILSCAE